MASLAGMLAGSALGQGAANFVQGQTQGAFDRTRLDQTQAQNDQTQKVWDFQNNQMGRTLQEQQIGDTPTDGATDADKLSQLADIAGKTGRGDLQRKYSQLALQTRQGQALMGVANASRAITMGQFGQAAQMLNQTGLFGQIHSIGLADDAPQDPNNPTYSVYTAGAPDDQGNPTQGPHVHVTQQMLYAAQTDPKDALHWTAWSQAMGDKNTTAQNKVDAQSAHWDSMDNHWRNQDAAAMQKARSLGAAGAGKLTDKRWLYQWAQGQIGKPGGFADDAAAMNWATDPARQNTNYWQSMRVAGQVANSNGMYTADDVAKIAAALRGNPLGNPGGGIPPAPAPAPAPVPALGGAAQSDLPQGATNPLARLPGIAPVPGRESEGVYKTPAGVLVKMQGGKPVKWSNTYNNWIPTK